MRSGWVFEERGGEEIPRTYILLWELIDPCVVWVIDGLSRRQARTNDSMKYLERFAYARF